MRGRGKWGKWAERGGGGVGVSTGALRLVHVEGTIVLEVGYMHQGVQLHVLISTHNICLICGPTTDYNN